MARQILGRAPGIGKRWPHRALNFLPTSQLWKYLTWKSGGRSPEPAFHLGNALNDCRRILVLLPDSFQEILLALPVLQSLQHEIPDLEFQLVGNQKDIPFLTAMFGSDEVLGIRPEDLFWGESHFADLEKAMQGFQPGLALNLRQFTPPLLSYLIRASRAPLRAEISSTGPNPTGAPLNATSQPGQAPWPFSNLWLNPVGPHNILRRMIMATSLWNLSDHPVNCKWSRLKPGPDQMREAAARITAKGLKPENTRLFLWPGMPSEFQAAVLQAAVSERHKPGETKSLAIITATGALFGNEPPNQEAALGVPCLEAESTGLLLGFFAQTARSIGLNGPVLHLASLTDANVEAHFEAEDAPWDTSFLNPRMKVIYRNGAA